MMSVATTKTVITEAAMAAGLPFDLPENGHVSRLRTNWSVYEDGALAHKLQTEEISSHLQDNKRKNVQIRSDFPRALEEQAKEQDQNLRRLEERRQQLRQQEEFDSNVARRVAEQLDPLTTLESERDPPTIQPRLRERADGSHDRYFQRPFDDPDLHRNYENDRDRIFAERLQRAELGRSRVPVVPQPAEHHHPRGHFQGGNGYIFNRPSPGATPPLPVTDTGDVPTASPGLGDFSDVLPHVRGGVRYNDEQYLVKLARPALVTAEPVYANNRPEHYAVSAKFPQPETGAIAKIPRPLGPSSPDTPRASDLLLGATGLSQKDLALSKKAELQLEQERRDKELALELQKQFDFQESETQKQVVQAQDEEYAKQLHEKEVARLKRAKERSKMKKQLLKQQEDTERTLVDQSQEDIQEVPSHERSSSQHLSLNTSIGASTQNGNRRSDGASSANGRHSRSSGASRSFEEEMRPPARKPYMNPEAIDLHRSQFAVNREQEELREEDGDQLSEKDLEEEIEEPQYANIGPNAEHLKREEITREITLNYNQWPVPPYMPLQQPVSKKSTSLEKRIKKRKEKEGCKQQ